MASKKELLQELIHQYCAKNAMLIGRLPWQYQQDLVNFLAEHLQLTFLHIHNIEELAGHLTRLIKLVAPVLLDDSQPQKDFYKLTEKKQQVIARAMADERARILQQNRQRTRLIEEWQEVFSYLRNGCYADFLNALMHLLEEFTEGQPTSAKQTVLMELLQSLHPENIDVSRLQILYQAIDGAGFPKEILKQHKQNIEFIQTALSSAIAMNAAPAMELLNNYNNKVWLENLTLNIKSRWYLDKDIQKQIALEITPAKLNFAAANQLVEKLLTFIKSLPPKAVDKTFKQRLKEQFGTYSFFGVTIKNIDFVSAYAKQNIPEKPTGYCDHEWVILYKMALDEVLHYVKVNSLTPLNRKNAANLLNEQPIEITISEKHKGAGGDNIIYEGTYQKPGKIAGKVIYRVSQAELQVEDPEALKQIDSLDHPAIIKRYSKAGYAIFGREQKGSVEYVEHASRGNLKQYPLSKAEIPSLFYAIIDGLKFLHDLNIVHHDIKPENIVLGDDGIPRIIDFDLARYENKKINRLIRGTPPYWPPEIFNTKDHSTLNYFAIDVWALGVMLYHLYTGELPPLNDRKEFVGFGVVKRDSFFARDLKDPTGGFINKQAELPAQVIEQLLATNPTDRMNNFRNISSLPYFQAVNKDKVYNELAKSPYAEQLKESLTVEFNKQISLKNKLHQGASIITELTMPEKIRCYQKVIENFTLEVKLTPEDESLIDDHINIHLMAAASSLAPAAQQSYKDKAKKEYRDKVEKYKKLRMMQALDSFKEELKALQQKAADKIIKEKLFLLPDDAEVICAKLAVVKLTPVDSNQFKKSWKQLKKQIKQIKRNPVGAQQMKWLEGLVMNYNTNLLHNDEASQMQRYLMARELLNVVISIPGFQENPVFAELFIRINNEIDHLNKSNPFAVIVPNSTSLSPEKEDQKHFTIPATEVIAKEACANIPTVEQWQTMTTRCYEIFKFIKKQRKQDLKVLDKLIKDFHQATSVDEQINTALKLIVGCQHWLANKHNSLGLRYEVVQLQTAILGKLNWLLGQAISANVVLEKTHLVVQKPRAVLPKGPSRSVLSTASHYLSKLIGKGNPTVKKQSVEKDRTRETLKLH